MPSRVHPKHCDCIAHIMECRREFPTFIPRNVTEITLYGFDLDKALNFSNTGWLNVTNLLINPGDSYLKTRGDVSVGLTRRMFERLENLENLQIACRCLRYIERDAFYGLDKLKKLDLSNNRLTRESFIDGIKGDIILPNLEELVYSNTSVSNFGTLILDEDFLNAIRMKPLKVLDLSRTNVLIPKERDLFQSLIHLEKLNISESGSAVARLFEALYENLLPFPGFPNLTSLDLSFPSELDQIVRPGETKLLLAVSPKIKELHFRKFLTQPLEMVYGIHGINRSIPYFSQTDTLCVTLKFPSGGSFYCVLGQLNFEKLVLSENTLRAIDPNSFHHVTKLKHLDLSKNRLGDDFAQEGYLKTVFENLKNLEVLDISGNDIRSIPHTAFTYAEKLQVLDLSHNELTSVTFSTNQLKSLQHLDLRHNKIIFLDELSLQRLNDLKLQAVNITPTKIDFDGNPIACSCDNRHYFNWTLFYNEKSSCLIDGTRKDIDYHILNHSYYLCNESIVITVFTLLAIIEVAVIAVIARFILLHMKYTVVKNRIRHAIERYKENRETNQKIPVFISFCSEDDEIVMEEIVPKLEDGLRKLLDTDARCVATGYNDFCPGMSLANEIIRCVEKSSVVIFFVTNAFCRKLWCRNETLIAYYENKPTILMIWEELDLKLMPKYLYHHYQHHTRVHWVTENGQRVMKPDWDKLCESVVSLFTD